ncbi:unnamed protein product [Urochloa humidicola]
MFTVHRYVFRSQDDDSILDHGETAAAATSAEGRSSSGETFRISFSFTTSPPTTSRFYLQLVWMTQSPSGYRPNPRERKSPRVYFPAEPECSFGYTVDQINRVSFQPNPPQFTGKEKNASTLENFLPRRSLALSGDSRVPSPPPSETTSSPATRTSSPESQIIPAADLPDHPRRRPPAPPCRPPGSSPPPATHSSSRATQIHLASLDTSSQICELI